MDHSNLKSKLYEFYDGELPKEEAEKMSVHLQSCAECRRELELLKKSAQIFFKKSEVSVPPSFSAKVMNQILERSESPKISILDFFRLPRWEIATALSISLLIFSYFSIHYLKEGAAAGASTESWLFSNQEPEKDDLLQIALGNESLNESGPEVKIYE